MIFQKFCEQEFIDPQPFREFCMNAYISGWQIIHNPYAVEFAWKEYLGFTYMRMLAELETK